ncbi:antitoxin [Trinickia sp. NRRL B-1857]
MAEEAVAYDRWLRAKVQVSMDDERQGIAHDDVMVEIDTIIQLAESRSAANRS